jgi:hypothetical protein
MFGVPVAAALSVLLLAWVDVEYGLPGGIGDWELFGPLVSLLALAISAAGGIAGSVIAAHRRWQFGPTGLIAAGLSGALIGYAVALVTGGVMLLAISPPR